MSKASPDTDNNDNKFSWRIFGPGILLATGAVGGSHLISSTQAGVYTVGNWPS